MTILPYHVLPPLGVKNAQTSVAFAVVVRDKDAAPFGNKNVPPDQATVRPDAPSLVKIKVNAEDPDATG